MLRVSFSSMTTARAAVNELEAYGYSAQQFGREVVTDCPALLAVPTIQKRVGFSEVERLELKGVPQSGVPRSMEPTDEFPCAFTAGRAEAGRELTA